MRVFAGFMQHLLNLDSQVFLWLNGLAHRSRFFDFTVVFLGHYLPYCLALAFALYWFVGRPKIQARQSLVAGFMALILGRGIFVEIIRLVIPRNRPFISHQAIELIAKDAEKSFPSGHATALAAIATAVYFYNKKLGIFVFVLAALVSVARVIDGVHYPLDILGGFGLGVFTGWLIIRLWRVKLDSWAIKISNFTDKIFRALKNIDFS